MISLTDILSRVVLSMLVLALSACATSSVDAPRTTDNWSRRIDEIWVPRTQAALRRLDETFLPLNVRLEKPPRYRIVTQAPDESGKWLLTDNESTTGILIVLPAELALDGVVERVVMAPVEIQAAMLAEQLAHNKLSKGARWLLLGTVEMLAYQISEELHLSLELQDWQRDNERLLRTGAGLSPSRLLPATGDAFKDEPGFNATAGWAVTELKLTLGERYLAAWCNYWRLLGQQGVDHAEAFKLAFGQDLVSFSSKLETRLYSLRAEQRRHAKPVPPADTGLSAKDIAHFPLRSAEAIAGLQRYLEGVAPKALAFSRRGTTAWTYYADRPDAVERALRACNDFDSLGCSLYAVDDQVVYQPPSPDSVKIRVELVCTKDEGWGRAIERDWLPVVQGVAGHFLAGIRKEAGEGLTSDAVIYAACSRDDFYQVLSRKMAILRQEAGHFQKFSAGVANGAGRIAVILEQRVSGNDFQQTLTEAVLHELVHEWQGQLSSGEQGFQIPHWLSEGSAEVLARRLAGDMPGQAADQLTSAERATELRHLFRLNAMPAPKEIYQAGAQQWRGFADKKTLHYAAAELMTYYLSERMGNRFALALKNYFSLSGVQDKDEATAFSESFGMSSDDFLASYTAWLERI